MERGQVPLHYPPPLTKGDDKLKEVVELLKFMQKNPTFLTNRMLDVAISLAESED